MPSRRVGRRQLDALEEQILPQEVVHVEARKAPRRTSEAAGRAAPAESSREARCGKSRSLRTARARREGSAYSSMMSRCSCTGSWMSCCSSPCSASVAGSWTAGRPFRPGLRYSTVYRRARLGDGARAVAVDGRKDQLRLPRREPQLGHVAARAAEKLRRSRVLRLVRRRTATGR